MNEEDSDATQYTGEASRQTYNATLFSCETIILVHLMMMQALYIKNKLNKRHKEEWCLKQLCSNYLLQVTLSIVTSFLSTSQSV